ncbi:Uric acid transporter UacT [bacterium YEK0313]|nr:Uric acid transporter UacT [bacterium YEK0313]
MTDRVHPVDEVLPTPKLFALGLQHVLVMYAGAIAVPLIIGRALGMSPEQVALLISADLFACGVVTLIQSFGMPGVGIRLPVMMGVTFASVAPMLAIGRDPSLGITGIFGAIIASGLFALLVAPFISRMLRFFPPVVTGTIILVIGVSLMRVGIGWAAGGPSFINQMIDGKLRIIDNPNPGYGALDSLGLALFVLCVVLALTKYGKGFVQNIAVLLGIIVGCVAAYAIGKMNFDVVGRAHWFGFIYPFQFGLPKFEPISIITMCLVMIVVMIESTGMFLAIGDMTGRKISQDDLTKGLRADGLGTMIGGLFNTFPYTSFSQNVGLVGVTGVRSRFVTAAGGLILLAMGLVPKFGALAEAIPSAVLGGAGIVMFGMVAATGVRILTAVDFRTDRNNLYIVAVSVGLGMIPLVAPNFFRNMPHSLHPLLESGILLAAIAAVVLNMYFNGFKSAAEAEAEVRSGAALADAAH